jgi:protein-disulfide isomerase
VKAASSIPATRLTLPAPPRDHILGSAKARFALLEYGDYECPYCAEALPVVKAVQEELGKELCFAFRNFPLANLHPHALHAAHAAEAAAAQGDFWAMHDLLFENQTALEDDDLVQYALAARLDAQRLIAEVRGGVHEARVKEDFKSGVRAGVNGTPTFFVNGVRYDGPREVDALLAVLTG